MKYLTSQLLIPQTIHRICHRTSHNSNTQRYHHEKDDHHNRYDKKRGGYINVKRKSGQPLLDDIIRDRDPDDNRDQDGLEEIL